MTSKLENQSTKVSNLEEEDSIGELQVAEYLLLLFAFDTYVSHLEDVGQDLNTDSHGQRGLKLLKLLDRRDTDDIQKFLDENVNRDVSKKQIARTFRVRVSTPTHAARRALSLRTVLNRGGAATVKAIFQDARARRAAKAAIASHMLDSPAEALGKYSVIQVQNVRVKSWVRGCVAALEGLSELEASTALVMTNAVESATSSVASASEALKANQVAEEGTTIAEDVQKAQDKQTEILSTIQEEARETAQQAYDASGEDSSPPTRAEVVGIATAAAVAASSKIADPDNIPEPLKKLDPEQRAAALTDGRVLVAAGAGSGKSHTLVQRVKYLVEDRQVAPGRILVSSFNKKAALELEHKIGKAVGQGIASSMQVGTLHGTFRKAILKYGTPEEQIMFKEGFVGTGSKVASAVNRFWKKCYGQRASDGRWVEATPPSTKAMMMAKTKWAGNNMNPRQAMEEVAGTEKEDSARWYELYLGFKGDLGSSWQPPRCDNVEAGNEWARFNERVRTQNIGNQRVRVRLGDFDDMISVFRDILARHPDVKDRAQKAFDHVLIDECLHADSLIETKEGPQRIADLSEGDLVLSLVNGSLDYKRVVKKKQSSQTQGITVVTESGREIVMTPNHRVYASPFDSSLIPEGCSALYLMHRKDKGYRIGVSKSPRAFAERADAMWILEVGEDSEILLKEQQLSLKYAVPTYLFEGSILGCDQERIDRIFLEFGANGGSLLDHYGLDYNYPHWVNSTYSGGSSQRRVLFLDAHRKVGSRVTCSWTEGSEIDDQFTFESKGRRVLSRPLASSYTELRAWAVDAANREGLRVKESLSLGGVSYLLTTASALREGMLLMAIADDAAPTNKDAILRGSEWRPLIRSVASQYGVELPPKGCISQSLYTSLRARDFEEKGSSTLPDINPPIGTPERIVEIREQGSGAFYDISVEDSANFFANGILSHNCQDLNDVQHQVMGYLTEHITDGSDGKSYWMIGDDKQSIYSFRGARPDLFTGLDGREGWKTRVIRTNYRCPPEIVELANRLIAHNDDQIEMDANPSPGRARGQASVVVSTPEDEAQAAIQVAREIKSAIDGEGANVADHAVLARTNKELNSYETALLLRGIPYARKGSSSFLGSPETKSFLGYISLVTDSDHEKMQEAFVQVLNRPNRFFAAPDKVERAVDLALSNYARSRGEAKKTINPMVALRDPSFQEDLIYVLKGSRRGFKAQKGLDQLDALLDALDQLEALANTPREVDEDTGAVRGPTTEDLFEAVLDMPGTKFDVDPDTGRIRGEKATTFLEELSDDVREYGGEDDAAETTDPGKMNLGNVSFLFELAKTDPEDPGDLEIPPDTPKGFWAKMQRLQSRAKELRYDIDAWERSQADLPPEGQKPPPGVYLGTVHSTKGAQWPDVFVQMPKKRFPMEPRPPEGRAPTEKEEAQMEAEYKAERRLAYVALTRPSRNLRVISPMQYDGNPAGLSPFVEEAGLSVGENVKALDTLEGEPKTANVPSSFVEDIWFDWKARN